MLRRCAALVRSPSTSLCRVLADTRCVSATRPLPAHQQIVRRPAFVHQARFYAKKKSKKGAGGGAGGGGGNKRKNASGHGRVGDVVLSLRNVDKYFEDGTELFTDVNVGAFDGAKIGIVGVNGAGKSGLLKILAGIDPDFEGERFIKPDYQVGFLAQEPELDEDRDVLSNVLDGVTDKMALLERFNALAPLAKSGEALSDEQTAELAELRKTIDELGVWGLDKRVFKAMHALRCPPPTSAIDRLSGGERRRVALCRLLVQQPDILLLDEPTNHLDATSVAWLQRYLTNYRGTVIAITHDRYFLDGCAGWICEVDRGRTLPFQGNYSEWLEAKAQRLAQEKRRDMARERAMARELEWINAPQKARQAKSRARVQAYEQRLQEAQRRPYESGTIVIPPGRRLGGVVLRCEGLSKAFGDKTLFSDLSFELKAGQIIGVVGANGSGKTSLLRILTGEEQPDSGTVQVGETVDLGFVTQSRDTLDPENTVFEEISGGQYEIELGANVVPTRGYVASFNFRGDQQQKLVGVLSGGERNRVHLAKMIKAAPNVLLLDEPTNDLDVEVLRSLEESLAEFTGSGVVVSHDRWFLNRVCTHVLALVDGRAHFFEGTFDQFESAISRLDGDFDALPSSGDAPDSNSDHRTLGL